MKRIENAQMINNILQSVIACKIEAAGSEVSLSQIACRAGISERTLNRYFPDKEMLFYDASVVHLTNIYLKFAQRYQRIDQSGMSGLERLLLLVRLQADHNREDMSCAKVFVRAYTTALRTAVYRNLPVKEYDAPVREIIIQCISDGIKDGSIRSDIIPYDSYILIMSNYMGLVQRLIYFCSVEYSKEEHKQELLLVFNNYITMLKEYLSVDGRMSR